MLDSNVKINGVPVDEIYIDQGIISTRCPGYSFLCVLTPYGIQKLETRFAHRIQAWARASHTPSIV